MPKEEKLGNMNKKGSLMHFKKLLHQLKPNYDIYLWVKNFNDSTSTIYKNETELLKKFKRVIFRKKVKKEQKIDKEVEQIIDKRLEDSKTKSPEYHPQLPSM